MKVQRSRTITLPVQESLYSHNECSIPFSQPICEMMHIPSKSVTKEGYVIKTYSNNETIIEDYRFGDYTNLLSINISNNITFIGVSAFIGCIGLKCVLIPESVCEIGKYAFTQCTSLITADIRAEITELNQHTFSECTSLEKIILPPKLQIIRAYAFSQCISLKTIDIPEGVTSIENYAFYECSNIEKIVIPDSVVNVGCGAFKRCTCLKEIHIYSLKIIEEKAFSYCSPEITLEIQDIGDIETYVQMERWLKKIGFTSKQHVQVNHLLDGESEWISLSATILK